jgi:signal transduction histidine kinase
VAATEGPSDAEIIASVADDLPVGIWVARAPGGEFVYANKMFAEIAGMGPRTDAHVDNFAKPYGLYDRAGRLYPESRMPFVRALEERSTVEAEDIVMHRSDGSRVNLRAQARPILRDGVITHVVVACFDISRQVAAEQVRDDFISAASHELKTPIGALQIRAQSLLSMLQRGGNIGAGQLVEWVSHAERQVRRLVRLSETLLDVSRIRAGRVELKREPVDLALLVRTLAARLADDLPDASPPLEVDAPAGLPGLGDPLRLEQVLINLLSNAAKYGQGRPIHLTLTAVDGVARIVVRDQGIGISPEEQRRIFQPFERTASAATYGGLGLGLWIVQEIVTRMEGCIGVSSQPGRGATFIVEIPWGA